LPVLEKLAADEDLIVAEAARWAAQQLQETSRPEG
jgi:hypothetical protein